MRDRGLALASRVNRWLVAGAVGLSAVLSVAAANAFHGHQRTQSSPAQVAGAQQQPSGAQQQPSGADSLAQPAQPPAPATSGGDGGSSGGAGVVSGGS